MLTAVIIDDELKGRIALRQKLSAFCPEVELAGEAAGGEEGLRLIEQVEPEIVFLDIEMPRMNGFDMLQRLQNKNFHLVFTTAFDQYAIRAIKYAAFDYLLKPINIEELQSCIERIKNGPRLPKTADRLEVLDQHLHLKNTLGKIAISTLEGHLFFNINDIIRLEAQRNYTILHFVNQPKLTASKTLKELEELLPEDKFFRVHHTLIINLHYIKKYIKGDGGQIEMQNGDVLDVARRRKEAFLKLIGK
jgi:two-component system LytT family response regulator